MKHLVGMADAKWRQEGVASPVILDTDQLINAHMLIAGMSGTGKSFQINSLLTACVREGVEADVFDVHEELDEAPGCVAVKFSAATKAGFNPLVINLDRHSGGVRNQIDEVIDTINRTSTELGPRQTSALRNLLADVYYLRGCYEDNPQSWHKAQITEAEHDRLTESHQYGALKQYYPILRDVISYTQRKIKAMSLGSADSRAVAALEKVETVSAKINSLLTRYGKATNDAEVERLNKQLAMEKEKAIDLYADFINAIETGRESQDILKYTNKETLVSVRERLEALQHSGIFCSNPPNWRGAGIRVYQIGSLQDEQRQLLFFTRAKQILRECMDMGKTTTLRRLMVVDEGHLYFSKDGDNPMNRIAKEGRKYGLGLVVGSQSPTHFSEDFLTNCGTVVITGLHDKFWRGASGLLGLDMEALQQTRAKQVLLLKRHIQGEPSSKFEAVLVDKAVVARGVEAFRQRHRAAA